MRILLAHNSLYYPSFGGGDKSNRLLMEALAARGHDVRVVARIANFGEQEHAQFLAELEARGLTADVTQGAARFDLNGVDVRTLTLNPQLRAYFSEQVAEFDPDVILTSTDDPAQLLFDIARRAIASAKVGGYDAVILDTAGRQSPSDPHLEAPHAQR